MSLTGSQFSFNSFCDVDKVVVLMISLAARFCSDCRLVMSLSGSDPHVSMPNVSLPMKVELRNMCREMAGQFFILETTPRMLLKDLMRPFSDWLSCVPWR